MHSLEKEEVQSYLTEFYKWIMGCVDKGLIIPVHSWTREYSIESKLNIFRFNKHMENKFLIIREVDKWNRRRSHVMQ